MNKPYRPWQRRIVRRPSPNVVVTDTRKPLGQILFYEELVLYTRFDGARIRQYPIAPDAIAQTLGQIPHSSGLLTPNTLATGVIHGVPFFVQYIAPHERTLHMPDRSYSFCLPPLVLAGRGKDYFIWALGEESFPQADQALFNPPFPNTYEDGRICWGTSDPRPDASPTGLARTFTIFAESHFNLHVANAKSTAFPVSIVALWRQLDEAKAEHYPLDDLQATRYTLSWLIAGGPWGGGL